MRINSVLEIPRVRVKEIPEVRCLFGANWQAKMCRWASCPTVLLLAMDSNPMRKRESPSMPPGLSLMFAHTVNTSLPYASRI
jgi:hypothetical protein